MDYQLDLTAYRCPLPLLITKKALKGLTTGDELSLLLQDPSLRDFELLAQEMQCRLKIESQEGEKIQLRWYK